MFHTHKLFHAPMTVKTAGGTWPEGLCSWSTSAVLAGSYQRASAAPTSSRLARLWPLAKTSMYGSAAFMPRASGS